MPTSSITSGSVVYAKGVAKVSAFYAGVSGLSVKHSEPSFVTLEASGFQLVVVAIPARIANSIHITEPPQRREDTLVKLVFFVSSIATVRLAAAHLGGELSPPEEEWFFQGSRVCDGHDPEGNVVQFRENVL